MAYDVLALKQDLINVIHGTSLSNVEAVDSLIYRAARDVLLDVDPQETKRTQQFANPIYDHVYDYALPADLKGNRVIDIRPQVNRNYQEVFGQQYNQAFDLSKGFLTPGFTVYFNQGVKTIRLNAPFLNTGILINDCDGPTRNGTWSAGGNASNVGQSFLYFVTGGSSISFDLASGANPSTGYLENSTMTAVDLTDHLNQGQLFLYTYLPSAEDFTSIQLRFGSSSTDYYQIDATTQFNQNAFQDGWNLVAFTFASATTVGTPDVTAINYSRVTWTYDGTAQTGVCLDNIVSRLGSILEIEYYSKYLFRDLNTGAFQETVTDDSNLINLDTESYDLLFYKVAELAAQQLQGVDATAYDGEWAAQKYQEVLRMYKSTYKSEVQKPRSTYYKQANNRPGYYWRIRRP